MNLNRLAFIILLCCSAVSLFADEVEALRKSLPYLPAEKRIQALGKL